MEASIHRFVRLLRIRQVRISTSRSSTPCAARAEPGVLADRETLKAALRVSLVKDIRDEEVVRRDLRRVLRPGADRRRGPRARPRARPRGPLRRRRPGELHALRGAERDPAGGSRPRHARRHQGVLRPRGHGPAVQPAPGGQQDRPRGDDRRDRASRRTAPPTRPARARRSRSRPTASTAAGCPATSPRRRARRSTPTSTSPSRRRCSGGCRASRTGSATRATRPTRWRCAGAWPGCSRTSRRPSSATSSACWRSSSG